MANGIANIDAQEGTLVGVAHAIRIGGFVPMSVEVYNFDAANSYTLSFQAQSGLTSITIPPQFKFGIQGPLTDMTLTGTGAWKTVAFDTLLPAPGGFSALYGTAPTTADQSVKILPILIPKLDAAGDDLLTTDIWLNATGTAAQILGVQLYSRQQVVGAFGVAELAEVEIINSGTAGIVASSSYDSAPGGAGLNPWPAYTPSGPAVVVTAGADPADLVLAAGDKLQLSLSQGAAVGVGAFELMVYYRNL